MTLPYDFNDELMGLRLRLGAETQKAINPFDIGGYAAARPLVIVMEQWSARTFPNLPVAQRREIRMAVLSFLLQKKVRSTNELSTFQASIIFGHITDLEGRLTDRGRRFLTDLACRTESQHLYQAQQDDDPERPSGQPADLPDL